MIMTSAPLVFNINIGPSFRIYVDVAVTFSPEWWSPCRWQKADDCYSSEQRRCAEAESRQEKSRDGQQEPVPGQRRM